jgi:hypothetical protein
MDIVLSVISTRLIQGKGSISQILGCSARTGVEDSVGASEMTWMNLKPVDQLDNAFYAMHGDIRMINVPLSTLTELLEDVRTVEEEVAEEEERR